MTMPPYTIPIVIAVLAILLIMWRRYTKVGPNEVLVISGRPRTVLGPDGKTQKFDYSWVKGGGTFVWPIKEKIQPQRLSLELMSLDLRTAEVYTAPAIPVTVDGVAQVKVRGDGLAIAMAAQQFLSRSQDDIRKTALQTIEGHMRAILGTMTVEEIYTQRDNLAQKVRQASQPDLSLMGLEIISLTIRNISDSQGYLEALGKPRIAQVRRDAVIGEAEAERLARTARYQAETKIEEARRDHETQKAVYEATISETKADADLAYDLRKFQLQQRLKKEEMQVQIVEKEQAILLEEKEILRREKELEAGVRRVADAEGFRITTLANAERHRLEEQGKGEAALIESKGLAQAQVVKAEGLAEAEAMRHKADSWKLYNEAAVTEMFVNVLPKLAQAVAEPLAKTEKIVMISSGGDSVGAHKLTHDVAQVIAQLPPMVEALTGVKLGKLLEGISKIRVGPPAGSKE